MSMITISIRLDPMSDGLVDAKRTTDTTENENRFALIVGTNGEYREASMEEAEGILESLEGRAEAADLGRNEYIAFYDKEKCFSDEEGEYFAGSMVVLKVSEDSQELKMLEEADTRRVMELLTERMVVFRVGEASFSAMEL